MTRILKVGDLYVGTDGQLVNGQRDALRVDSDEKPRAVKLMLKRTRDDD